MARKPLKARAVLPIPPLDISSIDKASFFEDAEVLRYGNLLHSTALEDDFSPNQGLKASPKKAAAKGGGASHTETPRRAVRVKKGPTPGRTHAPLSSASLVPKGPQKSLGRKSRTRSQRVSERPEMDEETGRRRPLPGELMSLCSAHESTDDSNEEEPGRWSPVPHVKKSSGGRRNLVAQKRKSSSGSSGEAGPSDKTHRKRDVWNPIDLDVLLDAFLDFVSHFKETVDSAPVRKAIDAVSDMFEDHLTELITNTKELNSLKTENIKINSTINKKRTRLVKLKSELMTKESQFRNLQKERTELQERLADLQKATSFLSGLRDMYKDYRAYRQSHPTEEEEYGPSSLPALLLETRGVLGAESQLKNINDMLEQALEQANQH